MNGEAGWLVGALMVVIGILLFLKGERRMRDHRQMRERLNEKLEEVEKDRARRKAEKQSNT